MGVTIKPEIVVESRASKYGYIFGSLGMLAGFGFAYKKDAGVLGWVGYGLVGSFIGGTIGSVIAKVVGEKMVATTTKVEIKKEDKAPKANADGSPSWSIVK